MPPRPFHILFLFLATAACLGLPAADGPERQQPNFGPLPTWADLHDYPTPVATADDVTRGTIERLQSLQLHLPAGQSVVQRAYTITSAEGVQDSSEISLEWDPSYQWVTIHWVRLRRGEEVLDLASPQRFQTLRREKNLQRHLLDGRLTAVALLEGVRIGDTIEYAYTRHGRNLVFAGHSTRVLQAELAVPYGRVEYRILHARESKLRFRVAGRAVLAESTTTTQGLVDHRWSGRELPGVEADDDAPSWFEPRSYLEFSTFETWAEVVRWGLGNYDPAVSPQSELAQRIAALRAAHPDEDDRIAAAVALVQEDVRYLGIMLGPGTHRPNAPDEIWRRRYGDCKDKSLLLAAVLRDLGFDAAVALVDTSGGRLLREKLPAPTHFDHAIVRLRRGGQNYWIDGTRSHQGTGLATRYLPPFDLALVLAEGETDLVAVEAPGTRLASLVLVDRLQHPAWSEPARLEREFTYEGRQAEEVRQYLANNDRATVSRRSAENTRHSYEGAEESAPWEVKDDRRSNRLVIRHFYRVPQPWKKGAQGRLHLELRPTAVSQSLTSPSTAPRTAPLAQRWPWRVEHRFEATLPENFPATRDGTVSVVSPAFRYDRKTESVGTNYVLSYRWEALAETIPPDGLQEYARQVGLVDRSLTGWRLMWQPAPPAGPSSTVAAWAMGLGCLIAALATAMWVRREFRLPVPEAVMHRAQQVAPVPAAVRGWLAFAGLGILLGPLFRSWDIWEARTVLFLPASWANQTPLQGLSLAILGIGLSVQLVLALYLVRGLSLHHHRLPRLFILQCMLTFGIAAGTLLLGAQNNAPPASMEELRSVFYRGTGYAAVWIPYFLLSKRVAATFIRGLPGKSAVPAVPTPGQELGGSEANPAG